MNSVVTVDGEVAEIDFPDKIFIHMIDSNAGDSIDIEFVDNETRTTMILEREQ